MLAREASSAREASAARGMRCAAWIVAWQLAACEHAAPEPGASSLATNFYNTDVRGNDGPNSVSVRQTAMHTHHAPPFPAVCPRFPHAPRSVK